uniref:Uncharacterized protein n=1 Tax=Candidatus Kentrum sp. DK TaxID=2126562 RepID=A0A450S4K7_9GAMM|nr:MAG: hypothetical protein BECKDK2373B_GA0170837_101423 [Candidatus Kentron sp. DK]
MCGGVSYKDNGEHIKVYFPVPHAALPVLRKDRATHRIIWGRRREEKNHFPAGGWARRESILRGVWDDYRPVPVKIAVDAFMEKDADRVSHWFDLAPGQYVQGLLAKQGTEERVYVVTIEPEDRSIHNRWPRIVQDAVPKR